MSATRIHITSDDYKAGYLAGWDAACACAAPIWMLPKQAIMLVGAGVIVGWLLHAGLS